MNSKYMSGSLEEQRIEFTNRKFLATPLAGLIIWAIIGIISLFFSAKVTVWTLFVGTGSIVYLGLFLSKFLTGTMWLPFSWIINHWAGIFHAVIRTISIVLLWYLLPEHRFTAIPFTIVLIYIATLIILNNRRVTEPRN